MGFKKKIRIKKLKHNRSTGGSIIMFMFLSIFAAFMVLPMVFTVSNAFKPMDEIFLFPPRLFVINPTLDNYKDLLVIMSESWIPFTRYLLNTLTITIIGTAGHVIIASMAAYAMEKFTFPGRNIMFSSIVLSLMFSKQVTRIPSYLIISGLGWVDTLTAIIVPAIQGNLGLYLMKQFMVTVPDQLLEYARVEGSSEWNTLWKIVMPIVKPAWLTLIIFLIRDLWNETGGAYIFSEQLKTLPVALSQLAAGGIARTGVASAVTLIMTIVPISSFIITQSSVIETMSTSGIKE